MPYRGPLLSGSIEAIIDMRIVTGMGAFLAWLCVLQAAPVKKIALTPSHEMTRADLWVAETTDHPVAILVLCPGMNGSPEAMIRDKTWQDFAQQNHLALVGISFASKPADLKAERGYTFVDRGSGNLLLSALRVEFKQDLPLLLCGFSSGAYFTELFVAWKPQRVLAWSAHATGRYENEPGIWPPGIVSCGEEDYARYGAALMHFKKGRAAGSKLLWVGLPKYAHAWPVALQAFIRQYFVAILFQNKGAWVDIDTGNALSESETMAKPAISAWLPGISLLQPWKQLNGL